MARLSGQRADDTAAREQHDAKQDQAEEELPALGQAAEQYSISTNASRRPPGRTAAPCRRG
jgi:hypothetical protein